MADEVREYLRAAQEAELRKDVPAAVYRLRQAAAAYRRRGIFSRALSVLRHALRICPGQEGLAEELAEVEAAEARAGEHGGDAPVPSVAPSPELQAALDALDDERELVLEGGPATRVPVAAAPGLDAWCSFCCQPTREAGPLAAGASGTFICGACAEVACALAGRTLPPGAAVVQGRSTEATGLPALSRASLQAARQVEAALQRGARLVVVAGPPSSGKSRFLSALVAQGRVHAGEAAQARGRPVWIKDAWALSPAEQRGWLSRLETEPSLRLVVEARAAVGAEAPVARGADGAVALLLGAVELGALLGVDWPVQVLDAVEAVGLFSPMDAAELAAHGRALLAVRQPACTVSERLLEVIVQRALASGRGAAEMEAQLRRLPPGRWSLPGEEG